MSFPVVVIRIRYDTILIQFTDISPKLIMNAWKKEPQEQQQQQQQQQQQKKIKLQLPWNSY